MTKIRLVSAVLVLALAGACAKADTTPPATPVPADCEPIGDLISWSPARTTAILTEASLYGASELTVGATGTSLLSQPFTPSITGAAAPASWLTELGGSLARQTGKPVHTTAPSAEGQSFGVPSSGERVPFVFYTGVDRVSADFEVRCDPTVRGTFHAWSRTIGGGVACEHSADVRLDAFSRLALRLCPDLPKPPPSAPVDAEELHPEDQPVW
jgi:hypothetical protein